MRRAFARKNSKRVPGASPPPLTSPLQGEGNRGISWLPAFALLLAVAGVFLSCSRGGALALATSGSLIAWVLYRGGVLRGALVGAIAALGLAVYFGIAFSGYDHVVDRLSTLNADSLDDIDARGARRTIWNANLAAIAEGGWLGAGAGTHAHVYPLYAADPPRTHYTHAENGYLQIVTENGVPGALLLIMAIVIATIASWRALRGAESTEAFAVAGACVAGLAASAVHSVCDFVWFVPACMGTTVVLGACVLRLAGFNSANSQTNTATSVEQPPAQAAGWRRSAAARTSITTSRPSRATGLNGIAGIGRGGLPWAAGAAIAALLAVGPLVAPASVAGRWDSYLRMAEAHRALALRMESLPPEAAVVRLAETHAAELAALEAMIGELQAVVDGRPEFATARQMLANRLVELFNLRQAMSDNRLGLAHIRDTAIQEQFASAAELRSWLTRATSGNDELLYRAWKHARRAAALAPLEGEPYLRLAELCFLEGAGFAAMDNYLMQAVQLRPYDGSLLFAAGQQWGGRGANDWAAACWKNAFALPGPHRLHIARALVGRAALDELLVEFRPEWDTLPEFWRHYQTSTGDAATLVSYAEQQAVREAPSATPARAVVVWRMLAEMQHQLGNIDGALASLERACRTAPEDYASRRLYGLVLCDANRFIEGEYQLRWCAGRRSNDGLVTSALVRASQARLAAEQPATQVR
jgi:tetratricopeptide (TPR) repeat protein